MVPRLRTICEDVHRRNKPRGIGKAASLKRDNVGDALQLHRNLASAIWAKAALNCFSAVANAAVVTKLAVELHAGLRKNDQGGICATACMLTVTAVTIQHEHWIDGCLVVNGPAGASTRKILLP